MPEISTLPRRRISSQFVGDTVQIDLSTDEEPARLYLTGREASRLAHTLYKDLWCKDEEASLHRQTTVADITMSTEDVWRLWESLEDLLYYSQDDQSEDEARDGREEEPPATARRMLVGRVNWRTEGF